MNYQGDGTSRQALALTKVTNAAGSLTKTFSVNKSDPDGKPVSTTSAKVYAGIAETIACADLNEFATMLRSVGADQAFTYGVTGCERAELVTKEELPKKPGAIARDRKHFQFRNAPGILMLDHDAGYLPRAYETADELRDELIRALGSACGAPMAWTPSASSFIVNELTGKLVKGAGGARLYIPVLNASDIPRAMKALREYLWAADIGTYSVSRSGQLIERTLFDLSTAQPERLDFVAGADCTPPLAQRRPDPIVFDSELEGGVEPVPLESVIPDPDRDVCDRAEENRKAARARMDSERRKTREAYVAARVDELVAKGADERRARDIIEQAVERDNLFAEFELHAADGTQVTVGEVLDDPKRWHGARFADPLEPEYGNDNRIAYANLRGGGRPYIYSHAHGGKRYELFRQPTVLQVAGGDAPRLADACLDIMRIQQQVFDGSASGMLRVGGDGRLYPVNQAWLADHLGRMVVFQKFDARSKSMRPVDVPLPVTAAILARDGQRELPRLIAAVTAPTLRADGSVLDVPGYDAASELLYLSDTLDVPRVPSAPKRAEVLDALRRLWHPVSQFPFDGPVSRGVALAALLTACTRASLPTAPAFAFDAPAAGTGKTLLARCVALLGGHGEETVPLPGIEDERRKTIFSLLRAGVGCITFDNVTGVLGGDAFDQALTAPMYSSRVLGESRSEAVPNRAMMLITGNNLKTRGDTNRRVLRCRINARIERPYQRSFEFNPAQVIVGNRPELVAAALTIIRGYLVDGQRRGVLASFEDWDGLVRNAVLWCADIQGEIALGDPVASLADAEELDTEKDGLLGFLQAWRAVYGSRPVGAAEVIDACDELDHEEHEPRAHLQEAMHAAVRGVSRKVGAISPKELGEWLRGQKDVVVGGLFAERADQDRNGALWRVAAAT